jgi:SAM-dependent methyltransferase
MTTNGDFKSAYRSADTYDMVLLPHYFGGAEDVELIDRLMVEHYGHPGPGRSLRIAEFGCGPGRVSSRLAPYASRLVAVDSSPSMIETFRERYPAAETLCLDIRHAVASMLEDGLAGAFDVVGAFWSLNYPLGDCFEELSADGIRPRPDQSAARRDAAGLVRNLLSLLAPGGHFLALFFDSDTPEQRLVTRLWEKVAAFPPGGRGYTRQLLLDELRAAENRGEGWLTHTRKGGVAVAPTADAARAWFTHLHLKDLPALVNDTAVQRQFMKFIDKATRPTGEVIIPSGVHVIDFHAAPPEHHLPRPR